MRIGRLLRPFRPVLALLAAIWAIELVNWLLGHRLVPWLGLEPRASAGLIGVPLMPLLHASLEHAAANTVSLAVLGGLGVLVAPRQFVTATILIVLGSGLAVWLLGRPHTVHVGASGLIFGWFGYLLALGFIERSARTIIGSIFVIGVYGGMLWGMLPRFGTEISWEAHFFGVLIGICVACVLRGGRRS